MTCHRDAQTWPADLPQGRVSVTSVFGELAKAVGPAFADQRGDAKWTTCLLSDKRMHGPLESGICLTVKMYGRELQLF